MIGLLFAALVTLSPGPAPAPAACVIGNPLDTLIEHYPLVFEADVTAVMGEIEVPIVTLPDGKVLKGKGLVLRMQVRQIWKGDPGNEIEIVYTHHAEDIHGRFDPDERFIVWAYRRDDRWHTHDCAPTIERERASTEMLAFLERLKKQGPLVVR